MILSCMETGDLYPMSDKEIMRRIGEHIRTIRLNENITRKELGRITGIHEKSIGDVENGGNVTLRTLIPILRGLRSLDLLEDLAEEGVVGPAVQIRLGRTPRRASGRRD